MEHSTLYDEKRTLVDKVIALTEENHLMDQLIMKMLKAVNDHCRLSGSTPDSLLRDELCNMVLKFQDGKNTGLTKTAPIT